MSNKRAGDLAVDADEALPDHYDQGHVLTSARFIGMHGTMGTSHLD